MRGVEGMTPVEQALRLRGITFALVTPPAEISMKARFRMGEITMEEAIYRPLIDRLAPGAGQGALHARRELPGRLRGPACLGLHSGP